MKSKTIYLLRKTKETKIEIWLALRGKGKTEIKTGLGMFDHLLTLLAYNALLDLKIKAKGDLEVDEHHLIEDVGITLGLAIKKALGDKKGLERYGFTLPMDETLAEAAIDLSGRPFLVWNAKFKREKIGELPTEVLEEFFRALANNLGCNIHINLRYGKNEHHRAEAIFKAFGRALRAAIEKNPSLKGFIPSTKGKI
ncbi:MAG: imidazoleglycerol-phosphate dehydratase HisB [Patescibacteria group bacterium]|nr:imidazoleglycerol-phosphate dehydratase HisB [Patescibacteria group bacterium]